MSTPAPEQLLTVAEMGAAVLDPDSPHYLPEADVRMALATLVCTATAEASHAIAGVLAVSRL